MRTRRIVVLRAVLLLVLGLCLWKAAQARAATTEYATVSCAAVGASPDSSDSARHIGTKR